MQQTENRTSHRRSRSFSLPPEDLVNVRSFLKTMPLEPSAFDSTNTASNGVELQRWPTPPELECAVFDDEPLRASVEASRNAPVQCLSTLPALPQPTVTTKIEATEQQAVSHGPAFHFSRLTSTWHGIHRPHFSRRSSKSDEEHDLPSGSSANIVQAVPEPPSDRQRRKRPSLPKLFSRFSEHDSGDDDGHVVAVYTSRSAARKRSFHFDIQDLHMPYFPG
ncbi:hypothetical protein Tdes44962_MAKER02047 [Teratosphaeria destructans]|uniref:Uncharacterized protein n=1 Tax=Teratosphaeria destructans TaxID=418781 RepID=A0A9W7W3Y2_9PEZI|nr:hypothetical protein Tdes44962_MAKER02047 [Teratosphaeria destructans]